MYRNVFGFSIYGNEKSIVMVYRYGLLLWSWSIASLIKSIASLIWSIEFLSNHRPSCHLELLSNQKAAFHLPSCIFVQSKTTCPPRPPPWHRTLTSTLLVNLDKFTGSLIPIYQEFELSFHANTIGSFTLSCGNGKANCVIAIAVTIGHRTQLMMTP